MSETVSPEQMKRYQIWFQSLSDSDKRNKLCPCGTGKKFKVCCLNKPPKYTKEEIEEIFTVPENRLKAFIKRCNSGLWAWIFRWYYRIWNRIAKKLKRKR